MHAQAVCLICACKYHGIIDFYIWLLDCQRVVLHSCQLMACSKAASEVIGVTNIWLFIFVGKTIISTFSPRLYIDGDMHEHFCLHIDSHFGYPLLP